jgi:ribosomal-protein-alanine N-acetyltransferase
MEQIVFLEGETVHLRPLTEADLSDRYLQWLNDEEVTRFNSHGIFPNTYDKMRRFYDSIDPQKIVVLAIIDKKSKMHVGNVSLQGINWINRSAEFAMLIGEKEFLSKGIGTEVGKLIFQYGFERLNLHRIYSGTVDGYPAVRRLVEKLNMKEEGRRREAIFKFGAYHDLIEYGILRSEFSK